MNMPVTSLVKSYVALRDKVRQTLVLGQQRIEASKLKTYWETGAFIHQHVRANGERARYGEEVIRKLADDIDLHYTVLQRCARFAEAFPDFRIVAQRQQLTWAHYRILLTIPDEKLRLEYAVRADREEWSSPKLQQKVLAEIREEKGRGLAPFSRKKVPDPLFLKPRRGTPGLFRVIRRKPLQAAGDELVIDLGFSVYLGAAEYATDDVRENDIVEFRRAGKSTIEFVKTTGKTEADLFTYKAFVERVVDGDTLRVKILIGHGLSTRQYLRLRGIDCPELATKEGLKARDFVQSALKNIPEILITTSRSDKYDRYLADVFFEDRDGKEAFLNNLLLQKELAVTVQ